MLKRHPERLKLYKDEDAWAVAVYTFTPLASEITIKPADPKKHAFEFVFWNDGGVIIHDEGSKEYKHGRDIWDNSMASFGFLGLYPSQIEDFVQAVQEQRSNSHG